MVLKIKKNVSGESTTADVVDGHLILSLLNANDPKIWRMPLDKIGAASFELKSNAEGTITKLILKPKKGTAEIIAEFNNKEEAFLALSHAANALQDNPKDNTKTSKRTATTGQEKQAPFATKSKEGSKWGIVLLALLIVIGLYYYLTTLMPEKNIGFDQTSTSSSTFSPSPQESTGVPISADDYLNGIQ